MVQTDAAQTTEAFRARAERLLERLIENRALLERRLAEAGRSDMVKRLTGRSALDDAIERTRELLEHAEPVAPAWREEAPIRRAARRPATPCLVETVPARIAS